MKLRLTENDPLDASPVEFRDLTADGYVYAAQYSNGITKVGFSGHDPEGRIRQHDRTMGLSRVSRVSTFISPLIAAPRSVERHLIDLFGDGSEMYREWISGLTADEVKCVVLDVSIPPNHPEVKKARTATNRDHDRIIDNFRRRIREIDNTINVEGYSFRHCFDVAGLLEQVMLNTVWQDRCVFDKVPVGDSGIVTSWFRVAAALTMFTDPREKWDILFHDANERGDELIEWVEYKARVYCQENGILESS